jgi:hypothetical protein
MVQQRAIRAALAGACLSLLPALSGAQGVPLPPPGVAGQVLFSNPPVGLQVTTFGTFPLSQPTGSLQFTALGTPSPLLAADATMVPFFFGSSSGTLVYQMEVLGPAGDVPVSVAVSGGVSGSSELSSEDPFAGFAMTALWRFESVGGTPIVAEEGISTPALTGSFSQSFGETHELMLTANQAYKVTMLVNVGARGGSASAFIDPLFSFGAGVGDEYSFLFSEGIGNGPLPVPEPHTWLLLGAGLLATWSMSRARTGRHAATRA